MRVFWCFPKRDVDAGARIFKGLSICPEDKMDRERK